MGKHKNSKTNYIVDLRRPRISAEVIMEFVQNNGNPNKGRMSQKDYEDALEAAKNGSPMPHLYQPALLDAAKLVARRGRSKSQPQGWKNGILGPYNEGDELSPPRLHHTKDLRNHVPSDFLISNDLGLFIIGDKESAVFKLNPQKSGNYKEVVATAKRKIFNNLPENLVGCINTALCSETLEDEGFLVFNPYQSVCWGFLKRNGEVLSYSEIRSCDDFENVSFEALREPLLGDPISVAELVKEVETKTSAEATERNLGTLRRFSPVSLNCYGFRNVQAGHPLFTMWDSEDGQLIEKVCMALGCRLPILFNQSKWVARKEYNVSLSKSKQVKAPVIDETLSPEEVLASE